MKAIITVIGEDKVGIIASVCHYLVSANINVLDISQTIVSGYFNMMMIVDVTDATVSLERVAERLQEVGDQLGVNVRIQHEAIFSSMHRV